MNEIALDFCFFHGFLRFFGGCSGPAVKNGAKNSFLNADELVKMTDQMAVSIMSDPDVQAEMAKGPLTIVIKPVSNQTNEIIRDNRKELFVARLQGLLSANPNLRDKFVWVVNREDYEKLRAEEIPESQLQMNETRVLPDYALWGTFLADTRVSSERRSDIYLCQFKLTRLSGETAGVQLWTGQYETSKHIKKDLLD